MGIEKKSNRWTLTIIGLVVLGGALIIGLGFPEAQWSGGGCGATPDEKMAAKSGAVELAGFSDDAAEVDAAQAAADTGDNAPPSGADVADGPGDGGADTDAHVGVDGTVAGLEHQCNSAYKEVESSQEQCNLLRSEERCLQPQHAPTRSSLCFWYAYPIGAEAEGSNDTQAAGVRGGGGDDGGYDGGEVGAGRPIKEITDKCTSAYEAYHNFNCNARRQRKICLADTDECKGCTGPTKTVLAGVPLRRRVVSLCTWYGG